MSGLLTTLNSAASALDAQSQAIAITGNNIANASNPNYAEETPEFQTLGMVQTSEGPASEGLSVTVSQNVNAALNQMVQLQDSLTSGYTAEQGIYQEAQAALGETVSSSGSTTSESGLSSALTAFFNAFSALAADPTDEAQQETLVEQAGVLTDRFQSISQNLSQVQSGASSEVAAGVTQANNLLQQIASLNSQIASFEVNAPGSAVDLRNQREGDLEQLAQLMPIGVQENSQGEDTVTTPAAGGGSVTLVSNGTVPNALSFSGGSLLAGTTALDPTSGSMAGTIAASSGAVQTLIDNLNSLAGQIVTSVNAAYNPTNAAGGNFFASSGTTAATIALDPNLTASSVTAGTGAAGDNSIATAVANLANQTFSTSGGDAIDGTFTDFYGNAVSSIGQALDTANANVTEQTNVQTIVSNQRASASGVSIDQEMSNLMTYQKAYQASAEVFQMVNSMLDYLVNDLGVVST